MREKVTKWIMPGRPEPRKKEKREEKSDPVPDERR